MRKTVIVTGASSGIGKACVEKFYKEGYNVVLAARSVSKMKEIINTFEEDTFLVVPTDVSKKEECYLLIEKAFKKFGRIDILINNAGISMRALFSEMDIADFERVMAINFGGTVYCTHAALPYIKQTKGSIVGVSSVAGYRGLPARSGYSASKFAMNGFLEVIRTEEMKNGVHVLTACPGFTESNIRNVALDGKGNLQGKTPRNEAKMMSASTVADFIFKAIKKRKPTLILTSKGKLTVFLNKILPRTIIDRLVYNNLAKEENSPFK